MMDLRNGRSWTCLEKVLKTLVSSLVLLIISFILEVTWSKDVLTEEYLSKDLYFRVKQLEREKVRGC